MREKDSILWDNLTSPEHLCCWCFGSLSPCSAFLVHTHILWGKPTPPSNSRPVILPASLGCNRRGTSGMGTLTLPSQKLTSRLLENCLSLAVLPKQDCYHCCTPQPHLSSSTRPCWTLGSTKTAHSHGKGVGIHLNSLQLSLVREHIPERGCLSLHLPRPSSTPAFSQLWALTGQDLVNFSPPAAPSPACWSWLKALVCDY